MADYLTTDTDLTSVADAIRAKGGTSAALEWPSGYVQAIADIPSGGGGGMLITVTLTENGSTTVYSLDKTVGEILSALSEGISPLFSFTDSNGLHYFGMDETLFVSSSSYFYIKSTRWSDTFSASGLDAYPSFTVSGAGGGSND